MWVSRSRYIDPEHFLGLVNAFFEMHEMLFRIVSQRKVSKCQSHLKVKERKRYAHEKKDVGMGLVCCTDGVGCMEYVGKYLFVSGYRYKVSELVFI